MHLSYLENAPDADVMVFTSAQLWRIELYILTNDDATFTLVALAGQDCHANSKVKLQGPYQDRREAVAARSAIATHILSDGLEQANSAVPQWRLAAQRAIREVREAHRSHATDCHFDPDNVYFD